MGYVFISYSTKNTEKAEQIRNLLEQQGIDTWMAPHSIPPGSKYAEVITQGVRDCDCFLLVLSNASQASDAVDSEVELGAVTYHKPVVVAQIEDLKLNDAFTFYIHNKQILRVGEISASDRNCQAIIDSVACATGHRAAVPAPKATPRPAAVPAPTVTAAPKKSNGKVVIAVVAVLAVLALFAVLAMMFLSGSNNTPERSQPLMPTVSREVNEDYTLIFANAGIVEEPVIGKQSNSQSYVQVRGNYEIVSFEYTYDGDRIDQIVEQVYYLFDESEDADTQQKLCEGLSNLYEDMYDFCEASYHTTDTAPIGAVVFTAHFTDVDKEENAKDITMLKDVDLENNQYLSIEELSSVLEEEGFIPKYLD